MSRCCTISASCSMLGTFPGENPQPLAAKGWPRRRRQQWCWGIAALHTQVQVQNIKYKKSKTPDYIYIVCNHLLSSYTIFNFFHTTNPSKNIRHSICIDPQIPHESIPHIAKALPSTTKVRDRRMANTTLTVCATSINKDTHFLKFASDKPKMNESHKKNSENPWKLKHIRSGLVKHSTRVIKYSDFLLPQPNIHSHKREPNAFDVKAHWNAQQIRLIILRHGWARLALLATQALGRIESYLSRRIPGDMAIGG